MKISTLTKKLNTALGEYGDIDVTVSETLWLYNTIKSVRYVKKPYSDREGGVVELSDYDCEEDPEYFTTL